jgi:hypothetical protein
VSAMTGKELYEHLATLRAQVADTTAEASLDYVVDVLKAVALGGCSVRNDGRREDVVKGVVQYENVYVPIPDPENGK